MPHTHYDAFAKTQGSKKTAARKSNSKKSAVSQSANKNFSKKGHKSKENPFEYRRNRKNNDFNARKARNRKADKARSRAREKALQYEEIAIQEAEKDFGEKGFTSQDFSKRDFDKRDFKNRDFKNRRIKNHDSNEQNQNKQNQYNRNQNKQNSNKQNQEVEKNSVMIPDTAVESRENYSDDVAFAQLGVPQPLVEVLRADGKNTAFPIQQATLPDSLQGANILGRGRTGSGKTLAFSIPLVARLAENFVDLINSGRASRKNKNREEGDIPAPHAMILAPTRELVHQIDDVIAPLAAAYGMKTVTVYGGVRYKQQMALLKQGAQIVVACPGRLEDLLRQGALTLEKVMVSVLDEADEMADMGFLPAVTRLLEQTNPNGQRMLFSATLDKQVATIVNRFLPNALVHAVDDADSQVDTMTHYVFGVSAADKYEVLRKLASGKKRSIFFTRTKYQAKNMAKKFVQQGIPAVDLQGNLSQNQRDRHMGVFASGDVRVLVATDVAARGIDISDVALVVQTEPPEDPKSFLHRSGRTARAGESGNVVTLVLPNQKRMAHTMLRRAGVNAKAQDVKPESPILQDIVGDLADLQEGWSMPEPEQPKRKASGRGRGRGRGRLHSARDSHSGLRKRARQSA